MKVTRRSFLKTSAVAAPFLLGGGCRMGCGTGGLTACRRPSALSRVNLAVIGCGTMGVGNMSVFLQDPRVQVTTVCDPVLRAPFYGYQAELTLGRGPAKEQVDAFYKTKDCRAVADFREVIADPSVDAVLIATPDHWHAYQSIAAMKAGKHVYCQKPMSLGISEGQEMVRVAKASGVTFQVGSQQRSASEFRVAAQWVASGYLGDCRRCDIGLPGKNKGLWRHRTDRTPQRAPDYFTPSGMWDLWQGPAAHWENDAYIPGIHDPMMWRFNSRTGGGQITDWGAHHFDILQWALGMDKSGPVAIENMQSDLDRSDRVFDWPANFSFEIVYANGFRARVSNRFRNGLRFCGEKGDLFVTRRVLERPDFLKKWNERRDLKRSDVHLYRPYNGCSHEMDFINAVYTGGRTACPCETGHRSITIAHMANICLRLGVSSLKWDPAAECFPDNPQANRLAHVPYANGWSL